MPSLSSGTATAAAPTAIIRCEACGCRLHAGTGDDLVTSRCRDHKNLKMPAAKKSRAFTSADKALIKSLRKLPTQELLEILNTRLLADVGDQCAPYSLEQLNAELTTLEPEQAAAGDWGSLRRLLAAARRSGLLPSITPQVVDDFAVCFQLTAAQHLKVKDVIRDAQESR